MHISLTKLFVLGGLSAVGTFIAQALGGWDTAMIALIVIMGIDYITGVMIAAVWKKSGKSETGAVDSRAGFKGLCRKVTILLAVLIGVQLDRVMNLDGVARTAVILFFIGNEGISIVENMGIMGVPLPPVVVKAFEQLRQRGEEDVK
jgi:toxin secretion/phage lysis holin